MTVEPRKDVSLIEGYHSAQVEVDVRLNTNESPEPPPPEWTSEVLSAAEGIEWHRYPDREATALREAIAQLHGVDVGQVYAANGSNEVLQALMLVYGGAGRTAAVWEPTYALHGHIARIVGTDVAEGERGPDFELDLGEVEATLDAHRPSVAFLCSPNNPTGVVDDPATVRAVLDMAMERDCLLVVDEAYGQFASWSALELVDDSTPLVVTRTFSKTWSMAGARLGYFVGPDWVVDAMWKVTLPYHLDSFKQAAGLLALDHVDEMEARVERVVAERERLVAAMRHLGVHVWPSGANFVLFRPPVDGRAVWNGLVERSVLVRDCSSWPRLEGCLRVTVGTPQEDDALLAALEEVLR